MDTVAEIRGTRKLVYDLMASDSRCRGDDKWLCYQLYNRIASDHSQRVFIPFDLFNELPSFETISRARRYIQNDLGLFLSTAKITADRGERREIFREVHSGFI